MKTIDSIEEEIKKIYTKDSVLKGKEYLELPHLLEDEEVIEQASHSVMNKYMGMTFFTNKRMLFVANIITRNVESITINYEDIVDLHYKKGWISGIVTIYLKDKKITLKVRDHSKQYSFGKTQYNFLEGKVRN